MKKELLLSFIRFIINLAGVAIIFQSFLYLLSNIGKTEFNEFNFYDYLPLNNQWFLLILLLSIIMFSVTYLLSLIFWVKINDFIPNIETSKIRTSMIKTIAMSLSICIISCFYSAIPSITTDNRYVTVLEKSLSNASEKVSLDIKYGDYETVKNDFIDENFVSGAAHLSIKNSEVIEKLTDTAIASSNTVDFQARPGNATTKSSGSSGLNLISDDLDGYPLELSNLANPQAVFQSKNLMSTLDSIALSGQAYFETDIVISEGIGGLDKLDHTDEVCIKVGISSNSENIKVHYVDKCFNYQDKSLKKEYDIDGLEYTILGKMSVKIPQEYNEGFGIYVYLNSGVGSDYKLNMNDIYNFEWTLANSSIRINGLGDNINSFCMQGYHDAYPSRIFHLKTSDLKNEQSKQSELLTGPCP